MPQVVISDKHTGATYKAVAAQELLQTVGAPLYLVDVVFDGCTIDADLLATIAVSLNGTHFKSCTFINCKFRNVLQGVVAIHARNLRFANCEFTNNGYVYAGTYIKLMYCSNVVIENCTFWPSENSVELIHCDNVVLRGNTFYGMWRHLPANAAYDMRSTGKFEKDKLIDNSIDLSKVQQYSTVKATERVAKGKADYITPYMLTITDTVDAIRVGDVVVIGTCFAVVNRVNNKDIFIDGWLEQRTLTPSFPSESVGNKYEVNRNYYGHVGYSTKDTIELFFGAWLDYNGEEIVPPQKCKYSILPHANYNGVNTSGICRAITVDGNRFIGGWADQISLGIRSKDCTVTNNHVVDGQDTGITVNGEGHVIAGNRVERQGCNGIWVNAHNCSLRNNIVSQWRMARGYIGNSYPEYNGLLLADCTLCTVYDNVIHGDTTVNCIVMTDCIKVSLFGNTTDYNGVAVCGTKTTDCTIKHDSSVVYPDGYFGLGVARGQRSDTCDGVMPEGAVKAGPGSIYRQALGPVFTKDDGFEKTGWHRI